MSEKEIRELTQNFVEAYNRGDVAAAAELYTEDAKLLPPNVALISGKKGIRDFWGMAMTMGMQVNLESEEVAVDGDLGYDRGVLVLTTQQKDAHTTSKGKYLIVVKRQNSNSWKIAVDIWNADPI